MDGEKTCETCRHFRRHYVKRDVYKRQVQPHQSHVVGDVAPHAPQAHAHLARVGVRRHQFPVGPPADVQVDAAHD